ncbi:hypothetical protein JK223_08820 [Tatumella sp. JGM118]|nr:hypothetical protein [Tatumella sp. JGM118]
MKTLYLVNDIDDHRRRIMAGLNQGEGCQAGDQPYHGLKRSFPFVERGSIGKRKCQRNQLSREKICKKLYFIRSGKMDSCPVRVKVPFKKGPC